MKAHVKGVNRIPLINGSGVFEQGLRYLEELMVGFMEEMTLYLCSSCINHSGRIYRRALAGENLKVGGEVCWEGGNATSRNGRYYEAGAIICHQNYSKI